MRVILAMLGRDTDSVIRITHEARTAADVDRCRRALAGNFQEDCGYVQTMSLIGAISTAMTV
jgi:hypothetical protein